MRRTVFCALILIIITLSGCAAAEPLPGEELILSARESYISLESARVEIINDMTGEAEQVFVFKCDEKGVMEYSYVGDAEGIHLEQYNNGREQFTNDNGEMSALTVTDRDFTAYSRDVPYPLAGEGLILFYKRAVERESSAVTVSGGVTEVKHVYSPERLGNYDGEGSLEGFEVTYRFDEAGEFLDMTEVTSVRNGNDVEVHSYTIYIKERNSVERIENPVDLSKIPE